VLHGAHWRHLVNTTEPSVCGGDAALGQIALTTCNIIVLSLQDAQLLHRDPVRCYVS